MARTTVDIDDPLLKELKRLQREERKPLGRLISDLLAVALSQRRKKPAAPPELGWISRSMGRPRIDLKDKDAVWAVLDRNDDPGGNR